MALNEREAAKQDEDNEVVCVHRSRAIGTGVTERLYCGQQVPAVGRYFTLALPNHVSRQVFVGLVGGLGVGWGIGGVWRGGRVCVCVCKWACASAYVRECLYACLCV